MDFRKVVLFGLFCFIFSLHAYGDGRLIPVSQLPKGAVEFIEKTFPTLKIVYAEKERDGRIKYEVHLSDGTEIKFGSNSDWYKIDSKYGEVPEELVPSPILEYVKTNFSGGKLTKIEKKRFGYEVEVNDNIDIRFNHQGILIGFDD